MADSLADVVARLRATTPALADVPDDVLTAEVVRQLQAREGPSVGDALGVPVFRTSNEKDAGGAAVVRADASPWTKAATIGAPGIGERYTFPSVGEVLASDSPLQLVAQFVTGHGRPRSVANADPLGITAFHEGKGPMPMFLGTTEEVGNVLGAAVGDVLGAGEGRGLYSRVDDAVSRLPAKGAHPNKIATLLKSNGATAEELAYRQVPEFLAAQGNATVTPDALQAHLDAHPAPLPAVVTRGSQPTELLQAQNAAGSRVAMLRRAAFDEPSDWAHVSELDRTNAPWWAMEAAGGDARALDKLQGVAVDPDHLETLLAYGRARRESAALADQIAAVPTTKYHNYQLPGGEAYQEHLLTLPAAGEEGFQRLLAQREEVSRAIEAHLPKDRYGQPDRFAAPEPALREQYNAIQSKIDAMQQAQYRSSHFDEPNILVHTRSNTRTLPTGERGRFVEEVQSDWHQAGKEKGYQQPIPPEASTTWNDYAKSKGLTPAEASHAFGDYTDPRFASWMEAYDRSVEIANTNERAVPDAPFKETWPDLGLKQQLLEAAKDPDAQWLGFTSGQTQAARYDLSKQISRVEFDAGDRQLRAFDHGGREVIRQTTGPEDLPDYIGKEAAQKLLASTPSLHPTDQTPLYSLSGVDLQVGGEGMHHFYDELLPKRLQKIVKPFGGTVERAPMGGRSVAAIDAEMDAIMANLDATTADSRRYETLQAERNRAQAGENGAPAWIVRLTPAMKARILKEGLPLSLLLGAAAGPSVAEALGSASSGHDQE